jgi:hypothetical protein
MDQGMAACTQKTPSERTYNQFNDIPIEMPVETVRALCAVVCTAKTPL